MPGAPEPVVPVSKGRGDHTHKIIGFIDEPHGFCDVCRNRSIQNVDGDIATIEERAVAVGENR